MAVSIPMKEQLAQLLNNLEEMKSLLKNNLSDFDQQVKQAILEWFDNPSDAKIDFKEVVSMVTTVNNSLLELKQMISVSCTKYQAMAAGDKTTQENKSVDSVHDVNYSDLSMSADLSNKLEQRVEHLEITLTSMQSRNKKTEDDLTKIKKWKDTYTTEESNIKEQIEQLALKQKHNSKQFGKQINEQKHITDEMNEEMKHLSEIKHLRDTLLLENNKMAKKLNELSQKQTDNNEKIREKIQEAKTKINELNTEIETLKENESNARQAVESTHTEMNKFDIILNKINEELEIQTTKTEKLQKQVKSHSDVISYLREEENKNKNMETKVKKLISMHSVTFKILQQRLMPVENLIQMFNHNLANRQMNQQKLATLENDVLKLSSGVDSIRQDIKSHSALILILQDDRKKILANTTKLMGTLTTKVSTRESDVLKLLKVFKTIETRVFKPYICQIHLNNYTPVTTGSILSTFHGAWEPNGSHFNRTTGKLVAPDDGFYLVIVTLQECEDKLIEIDVYSDAKLYKSFVVNSANTSAAGSTVIYMKKGQELYFKVDKADDGAKLQVGSGFTIIRL
ncbi:microtubule-associated tumor suppressor 1 homolog isoform X2 [Physella acuta]|uniref:microtubule-associated tumor suppressor 1 homolog isoform X2 n=2 Tax=Physella acuta TaxID=109671 RepID=UPI0027DACBE1|nr:microtubule-associated tumor suppressor 1 homolog isoform X2 [Physella acuta]